MYLFACECVCVHMRVLLYVCVCVCIALHKNLKQQRVRNQLKQIVGAKECVCQRGCGGVYLLCIFCVSSVYLSVLVSSPELSFKEIR